MKNRGTKNRGTKNRGTNSRGMKNRGIRFLRFSSLFLFVNIFFCAIFKPSDHGTLALHSKRFHKKNDFYDPQNHESLELTVEETHTIRSTTSLIWSTKETKRKHFTFLFCLPFFWFTLKLIQSALWILTLISLILFTLEWYWEKCCGMILFLCFLCLVHIHFWKVLIARGFSE